jgi:uncharacterized protein YjaZ
MLLEAIDTLAGLRAALEAPAGDRDAVFRTRVTEPTRPVWEPILTCVRPEGPTGEEPGAYAARFLGMYRPECGVRQGLQALDLLDRAGTWDACQEALHAAARALDPARHGVRLDRVLLTLTVADPRLSNENAGHYTGFGGVPGRVWVQGWPTDFSLPRLPAAVAHELHHNIRFRFEPFSPVTTTVGQYIVAEGLAEAFAAEVVGADTLSPVVNALSDEQLAAVRPRFRAALDVTGFDTVRGYVFGDWAAGYAGTQKQGLPDFAGYTVGYRVVRQYLERRGGSAAAATYVPWREILEGSGYL